MPTTSAKVIQDKNELRVKLNQNMNALVNSLKQTLKAAKISPSNALSLAVEAENFAKTVSLLQFLNDEIEQKLIVSDHAAINEEIMSSSRDLGFGEKRAG